MLANITTETVSICELVTGDLLVLSDDVTAKVYDVSLRGGLVVMRYDENLGTDYPVFNREVTLPTTQRVRRVV